jgi:hypothetical protein
MKIHALHLQITDSDLAPLVSEISRRAEEIEHLALRLRPEGLILSGQYPTPFGMKVNFDTLWQLEPHGHEIHARLTSIHLSGLNASLFRGMLLPMVAEMIEQEPGLRMEEDVILIDTVALAKSEQVDLEIHWQEIRTGEGSWEWIAGG